MDLTLSSPLRLHADLACAQIVGAWMATHQTNPLPAELSHMKGVALEESECLQVLHVLTHRLEALVANFEAVVPAEHHYSSVKPLRASYQSIALPSFLDLSTPPMTAESEEYSLLAETDTSFLRRELGISATRTNRTGFDGAGEADAAARDSGIKRRIGRGGRGGRRRRRPGAKARGAALRPLE